MLCIDDGVVQTTTSRRHFSFVSSVCWRSATPDSRQPATRSLFHDLLSAPMFHHSVCPPINSLQSSVTRTPLHCTEYRRL